MESFIRRHYLFLQEHESTPAQLYEICQSMGAKDSGHACHGKGVKKYVVQSVNGHNSCLGQQHLVGAIDDGV